MTRTDTRRFPVLLAAIAALLALSGALALPATAQAQSAGVLVSNIEQTDASFTAQVNANVVRAQQFMTGSNSGGYTLSEIVVNIRAASAGTPAFALYTSTSDDKPGTKVVDLGGESSTAGEQSFTPASATTLSASTKYIIAFYMTSGAAHLQTTTSNAVDPGASPGWNINTTSLYSTNSGTDFNSFGNEIEIAVKGTAVGGAPPSSDATLSGLTVTAGGSDLVTFVSGTETYTAMVANDVDEVTVTAMTTDSGASIDYLDGSDMTLDDADTGVDGHQVTLAEGDNVIKVKVTAADTTTKTYTVTVTQAAPDLPNNATTTGQVDVGGSVTSNIDRPGDGDWFGVALEADKRYQIDVEGMPTGRGTLPDTRIFSLYDADDTDLSVGDADGGVGNNARLIYTPTASGTYYVAVTGTGGTGTYTLSVIYLGANGASEADTDFPDDTTTTGKVDVGGSVTGNIDATDDFDRFGVDLEAGRTYQIDLEGMLTGDGTLEDPALDLFDPDNTFVDGNDDINFGAGNLNSRLTYTAPTTGTYFLRSLASVGGTGTYTLSVRDVTTLSGLTVTGGGSDLVTFVGTTDYTAMVANDVAEVTVTPMAIDSGATIEYLDGDDATINDAGTADGHQVALDLGENVIKVKVTATDGTTQTFTVTVTRAAAASTVLVSNIGQSGSTGHNQSGDRGQAFTTGPNAGGYNLESIGIVSGDTDGDDAAVSLCTADSDGFPTSTCTALTPPGSFAAGTLTFTAPAGTILAASTTYALEVTSPGDELLRLLRIQSDAEDTGGADGWTIADNYIFNTSGTWEDTTSGDSLQIRVNGTAAGGGTPSTPELSVGDATATEGSAVEFPVTLSEAVTDDVTATWTASFGSNEENAAAADLASTTGTVTIGGGDTEGTFTVTAAGDSTDEHDETFTVTLSGVSSNAQLATDPTATGTITDDDDPPSLSVEFDASVSESSGFVTFPVLMTAESGKTVTVTLTASAESGDTAESPADFTAESHVLTFDPGVIRVSTTFRTVNDEIVEDDETFTVTLSNVTNAVISDATATGTITNDDTADTTCTLNTGDLWCGVVTVEAVEISGTTVGYGFGTSAGALSDTGFTVGTNDYTIDAVMTGVSTLAGQLLFGLFGGSLTDADKANLVLHVDGHSDSFEVIDAGGPSPTGVYNWVSSGLDWTSTSEVTLRLREVTRATIADVAVTSTPLLTSTDGSTTHTYGVGETIELSVTFNEAVDATSDTDFVLSVSGPKRAPLLSGSGTTTLVFGYTVLAADVDANGIWIGPFDRTLAGDRNGDTQNGTITSVATGVKVNFAHSALNTLGGHRVDGGRSIVLVEVTSTPMLETDTYGADETIRFTVTFNAAVDVTGDPVSTFSLGSPGDIRNVNAEYESGTGTAELVFGYTVLSSDVDSNGIYQLGGEMDFDTVKGPVGLDADDSITFTATSADAPLAYPVRTQRSGHKVDGSQTAGVSSDATLSGLTVTAGGSDLVTFASGTTDYTASVANDVAEVTVTAETTDSGASVAYLDGDDMTLDDADTAADGHQVTLAEGDNVVKVKVTAADGSTETYTVTVSRAEAPTCTAPDLIGQQQIWTATLTLGTSATQWGFDSTSSPPLGALSDTDFDVDLTGATNTYAFTKIQLSVAEIPGLGRTFRLDLGSNLADADLAGLTLHVCDSDFPFSKATHNATLNSYSWWVSGSDWSTYATRTLYLSVPSASSDATLSGLTVTAGGTDLVTFASGTKTYTAMVASDVAEVTVTPTTNDTGATVAYLDGDDATITDADTGVDGHQVTLAEGDNVIKMKVTAEDTNATDTYTVTVTRAAPTCTLNTGDLWCGGVTVEAINFLGIGIVGYGFVASGGSGGTGALSDTALPVGTNDYTIDAVHTGVGSTAGVLTFTLASALTDDDKAKLVLHIDGNSDTFAFSDSSLTYEWASIGLDWSSESEVTLRVREAADASSDATLSALTVTAGGTDLVTFASDDSDYTASVANTVAEVTVTAETTDSGASIEYLDGSDMTLDDADTSDDGHQVTLAVGDTIIQVKVTAEDTTTLTYTVVVSRAAEAPACTLNTGDGDIWCGVVTVGGIIAITEIDAYGFIESIGVISSAGDLSDKEFSVTTNGGTNSYTIYEIAVGSSSVFTDIGTLSFALTSALTDDDRAKLVLHVDGSSTSFAFSDATGPTVTYTYVWSSSGLDWSSESEVTLRLRALPDAPTNFTAKVGDAQVALAWKAVALDSGVTGHEFRYKTDGDYQET